MVLTELLPPLHRARSSRLALLTLGALVDPAQVVVDDLGWHNVGWHNPDMITPNADELVANGMTCAAALRRLHSLLRLCSRGGFSPLPGRFSATLGAVSPPFTSARPPKDAAQSSPVKSAGAPAGSSCSSCAAVRSAVSLSRRCSAARRLDRSYQFWYCAPTRSSIMTGRLPYHVKCDLLSELTEAGSGIFCLRGI